ncbi:MAG: glutathione-dependent formaldehyde-activating [Proteobacteria bacterium]|nr:glutathione-dependent formaldehyde-activating [Pseudomonadota bacterium]
MRGRCLCGTVKFEIDGDHFKLYQCHCTLCRRQGGSLSNTATIVPNNHFRWLHGEEFISSWKHEKGFRSDFCSTCGSPVPNPLRIMPYIWVPAGLLENGGQLEIVAHLCTGFKASWDAIPLQGACYDELPNLSELIALIHEEKTSQSYR